jgi:hypothetical protein
MKSPFYAGTPRKKCLGRFTPLRCTAGNYGKQCNYVCYNIGVNVSAVGDTQPFQQVVNLTGCVNDQS